MPPRLPGEGGVTHRFGGRSAPTLAPLPARGTRLPSPPPWPLRPGYPFRSSFGHGPGNPREEESRLRQVWALGRSGPNGSPRCGPPSRRRTRASAETSFVYYCVKRPSGPGPGSRHRRRFERPGPVVEGRRVGLRCRRVVGRGKFHRGFSSFGLSSPTIRAHVPRRFNLLMTKSLTVSRFMIRSLRQVSLTLSSKKWLLSRSMVEVSFLEFSPSNKKRLTEGTILLLISNFFFYFPDRWYLDYHGIANDKIPALTVYPSCGTRKLEHIKRSPSSHLSSDVRNSDSSFDILHPVPLQTSWPKVSWDSTAYFSVIVEKRNKSSV